MFLFMISISVLFGACNYQFAKKDKPDDLIPQDTFTLVLQDVMVVESYFKHQQNNVHSYSESLPEAIKPIFKKYNVDSTRFSNSMEYYASRQKKLIEIYSQIQDSLTLHSVEYGQ